MTTYFLIISFILGAIAFFAKSARLSYVFLVFFNVMLIGLTCYEYQMIGTTQAHFFKVDTLSFILLAIQNLITVATSFQSYYYLRNREEKPSRIASYNASLILFVTALTGMLLATHAGAMWALLEATTLTGSLLIYHERNAHTLEATWKYLFVCSIGVALAFAGILFLSLAAQEVGIPELDFELIRTKAHEMDMNWLKLAFIFILVGFSTKMGCTPFFTIKIDANDIAPAPAAALFSSVLMNAGFLAIFRFYEAFANTSLVAWMDNLLVITAISSLVFSAAYLIKVNNIKRLLAYSGLEHAGIVLLGLAAGGKAGYYAAILHLIVHSLTKAVLFYQAYELEAIYKTKNIFNIGSYIKVDPVGALILLAGVTGITALPPAGTFISEIMIIRALFDSSNQWATFVVLGLILVIVFSLMKKFLPIIFSGKAVDTHEGLEKVGGVNWLLQICLLAIVFILGVYQPQVLHSFINQAIQNLPQEVQVQAFAIF